RRSRRRRNAARVRRQRLRIVGATRQQPSAHGDQRKPERAACKQVDTINHIRHLSSKGPESSFGDLPDRVRQPPRAISAPKPNPSKTQAAERHFIVFMTRPSPPFTQYTFFPSTAIPRGSPWSVA